MHMPLQLARSAGTTSPRTPRTPSLPSHAHPSRKKQRHKKLQQQQQHPLPCHRRRRRRRQPPDPRWESDEDDDLDPLLPCRSPSSRPCTSALLPSSLPPCLFAAGRRLPPPSSPSPPRPEGSSRCGGPWGRESACLRPSCVCGARASLTLATPHFSSTPRPRRAMLMGRTWIRCSTRRSWGFSRTCAFSSVSGSTTTSCARGHPNVCSTSPTPSTSLSKCALCPCSWSGSVTPLASLARSYSSKKRLRSSSKTSTMSPTSSCSRPRPPRARTRRSRPSAPRPAT
mmetsp:Transcript_17037/g.34506  ORF Transcript_17037/g.34506 Transcript_17037/m.34506 type:complete len:284 (+) Transcript_17037:1011-1862(+)